MPDLLEKLGRERNVKNGWLEKKKSPGKKNCRINGGSNKSFQSPWSERKRKIGKKDNIVEREQRETCGRSSVDGFVIY